MSARPCRVQALALSALCALVAGAVGRPLAGELPRDRDRWIQLRTANFLLWSDAGERRARELGAELEQLRGALSQLDARLVLTAARPTYLYVFKNRFALAPYLFRFHGKRAEVAGYYAPRPLANYMAIDGDARGDAERIVYHEYLHDVLHNNYTRLPLWLDEGLAEYFSTFRITEGEARIGLPREEHIRWLRQNQLIPLRQLFAVDQQSPDYHEGVRQGVFYAESWALIHDLMLGNPARRPQLAQMAKLLEAGTPQAEAFARAFGGDYAGLEQELRVYVTHRVFSYEHAPLQGAAEAAATVTPLPAADALYRLGDLLLNAGEEQLPDAQEHFRAALAADPQQALANAGLGQIEEQAGRLREAQADYEKAVHLASQLPPAAALAPHDAALVHLLLGRSLLLQAGLGRSMEDAASQAELARAEAELTRAADLAPGLGEVWVDLGRARLARTPLPAGTVAAWETARRLLPTRADVALNLAVAYAAAGEREKAEATIGAARLAGARPADLDEVREQLVKADFNAGVVRANAGDLAGAAELMQRAASASHDEAFRRQAEETLARVRGAGTHKRFVDAYNRAVDLANQGETRKAIAELEALLAGTPGAPEIPGVTAADHPKPPEDVAALAGDLLAKLKARPRPRG